MKRLFLLACLLPIAGAAHAGSIAVTPGSGATVGAGTDGTNQIPATILCGASASATLYATCVNQAIVNASGQLLTLDSQSGTWNITNISGTVTLPTGAATSALQTTGNTALTTINTTLGSPMQNSGGTVTATQATGSNLHVQVDNTNANGQALMAASSPVAIASDQSAVAVKAASGAFASGSIASGALASGALAAGSIASGAAVSGAFVAGSIADLAHGQGTMAASVPVAIASNQSGVPVTAASGAFASGALAAGSIASGAAVSGAFVAGSIADLAHGQGTMAASVPVAIASNQSAVPAALNATPSLANGNGIVQTQGGSVLSATNGTYGNVLQGNAVLSATNGLPTAPSPYPAGSTPITASATGTTTATTATLTNVTSHTTYICGFSIRANATTAATGNATVTGTITGTLNFTQWTAPNASGLGVTEEVFSPCVPASAVSTSIAVVSAAPGTGGVVSVTAWGYSI